MLKRIKITLIFGLLLSVVLSFSACKNDSSTDSNNPSQTNSAVSAENNTTASSEKSINNQSQKYVKTYSVYAEQGAVVTWFDSTTGQFRYKDKCETCGKVASGEHSGGLFVGEGSSYNAGFTCTNPNCSMWGKSQRAIIGCSVDGHWETDD